MSAAMKARRVVEIKGSTLPVLQIVVRASDPASLGDELAAAADRARGLLADAIAVLDLRDCEGGAVAPADIVGAARTAGLRPAAVLVNDRSGLASLIAADLPVIELAVAANDRSAFADAGRPAAGRSSAPVAPDLGDSSGTRDSQAAGIASHGGAVAAHGGGEARHSGRDASQDAGAAAHDGGEPADAVIAAAPAATGPPPPLYVTQPVRSGQRLYAQGRDIVVLAPTSRGAELIADGCIYAFVPLRGRALAGASGDKNACILATLLDAELVAVAGVYRTLEPADLTEFGDRAVRVSLAFDAEGSERLVLRAVGPLPSLSQGDPPSG